MNEYSLRDGKEFAEELRKRKESFLNNKSSKYYNKFSKLCDSIPISVQTINSAIDTPNAKPDEPGRKKLKEYTLYGYYAAWYLLGHVEEKAAKPDDIKIFSKYFMDNDADRVEKFLEEIFHNSQSQAGDFPVNSTTQPAKNVEPEKKDGMSKKQDMNNVILPEKMQWACDWWDRYKTRGTTAYQLEPMVKEKYIRIKMNYPEINGTHIMYIYKDKLPERVILLPFMSLREELRILFSKKVRAKDLVILLHGDNENRYQPAYKKYQKTRKNILEIEVNNYTQNVDDVKIVCNPFSLNYDYLLDLPI